MSLGFMAIRKHGSGNFITLAGAEVNGNYASKLLLVSHKIEDPPIKKQTISIEGASGVIDYTDVLGVKYDNRDITAQLREIPSSTPFDFDDFRRTYHGQDVDVIFSATATHYYRGRLAIKDDNLKDDFRTIKLTLDAKPFRYRILGEITKNVPSFDFSFSPLASDDISAGIGASVRFETVQFGSGTVGQWEITPTRPVGQNGRFGYSLINIPAGHLVNVVASVQASASDSPNISLRAMDVGATEVVYYTKNVSSSVVNGTKMVMLYATFKTVSAAQMQIRFELGTSSVIVSGVGVMVMGSPIVVANGGDDVVDVKLRLQSGDTATFFLNGVAVGDFSAGETEADFTVLPYLVLKPGNNDVAILCADPDASATITYEEAIL